MSTLPKDATYLGDGLYVRLDQGFQIELFAYNGIGITNQVYLEPTVWRNLIEWVLSQKLSGSFPLGGTNG